MIKDEIARMVEEAATRAQEAGELPAIALPEIVIERPQRSEHGDYATSLPLRLARAAQANPLDLGQALVRRLPPSDAVERVEVLPPGFVNFHLSESWLARQVDAVLEAGAAFAQAPVGQGQKVQVEFVSANPTGPLHAGNGRWAALGSTLARVLQAAGYRVETEYYFNDAGSQVDVFARTLYARYQQLFGREAPVPEDGYVGSYMVDLAEQARERFGEAMLRPQGEPAPEELGRFGMEQVMDWIRRDLTDLGVHFDHWYREQTVYDAGHFDKVMALLREKGLIVEREGAVWFATSQLGADKDEVVVRSSNLPTYLATDIGYHYDKFFVRDFHRVIDIWGADHQGHVRPLQLAAEAMGIQPERLNIIIGQLVTLRRGEEVLKISKRSGDIITLREVMDEVGRDACLFFFLSRSADAAIDFDLELAKRQSAENPVYYVQYAHARIAGILNHAGESALGGGDVAGGDTSLLTHPAELALIRKMLLLPELVETIARTLEPHHLPYYAQDLATAFHDFYEKCRVVDDDSPELSRARLKLVAAAQSVLATTLGLMGMSTPDRM
ncbi:MAG: arginine--tRNA ligase [Chloroflexi bacterium RBG_16_68_14]|nr:MAG: arginine--tRNA ligase [Chloroflexi bacterium RBG_16_68_14]